MGVLKVLNRQSVIKLNEEFLEILYVAEVIAKSYPIYF